MPDLAPSDRLPLTCTRQGSCCAGYRIFINAWELARLAEARDLSPTEFRDRHTERGGTLLRFKGAPGWAGKSTCDLYDAQRGCTAHSARPLACRLYPLGRRRDEGRVVYQIPERGVGCEQRCPSVRALPRRAVVDYLEEQDVAPSEAAHDAYANVIYGLVAGAASIAPHITDRAALLARCDRLIARPNDALDHIPLGWLNLLTVPTISAPLADHRAWVDEHRALIAASLQSEFSAAGSDLAAAVALLVALAVHLAPIVGADPEAMANLLGLRQASFAGA